MSNDLVPAGDSPDELPRGKALDALIQAAEQADTVDQARQIMLEGHAIERLLTSMRAPLEETRKAGKASVLAARRLGKLLSAIPNETTSLGRRGRTKSERRLIADQLELGKHMVRHIIRLSTIDDAEFQRYIQDQSVVPSISGALFRCGIKSADPPREHGGSWNMKRRRRAGVKHVQNPSLDEAYSLIVRALGHLTDINSGGQRKGPAIALAIDRLYKAEDALRPYKGGYVQ